MTGPEHFGRAEELAAEAHKLLGQGDGQATAAVWASVAQAHAVLALAAATGVGTSSLDSRACADVVGTRL
jgi:hydroxymethylglutaryl-CoA reductase